MAHRDPDAHLHCSRRHQRRPPAHRRLWYGISRYNSVAEHVCVADGDGQNEIMLARTDRQLSIVRFTRDGAHLSTHHRLANIAFSTENSMVSVKEIGTWPLPSAVRLFLSLFLHSHSADRLHGSVGRRERRPRTFPRSVWRVRRVPHKWRRHKNGLACGADGGFGDRHWRIDGADRPFGIAKQCPAASASASDRHKKQFLRCCFT